MNNIAQLLQKEIDAEFEKAAADTEEYKKANNYEMLLFNAGMLTAFSRIDRKLILILNSENEKQQSKQTSNSSNAM